MTGAGAFTCFYDQLKEMREYHRRFPGEPISEVYEQQLLQEVLEEHVAAASSSAEGAGSSDQTFSGEEAEGRYVDMHTLHDQYLNLPGVDRIDYTAYLNKCADLLATPKAIATTAAYDRYVRALHDYCLGFLRRTQVRPSRRRRPRARRAAAPAHPPLLPA